LLLIRRAELGDGAGAEHRRGQVRGRRQRAPQLDQHRALLEQAQPGAA
jgi:hypothetical protein